MLANLVFGVALAAAAFGDIAAAQAAETDQIAQSTLIGRSGRAIRACLGEPTRRVRLGDESIWIYRIGTLSGDGPTWLLPLDLNWLHSGGACEVRLVFDPFGVLLVNYALPGGAGLPLGQLCQFPVERCVP